jgi:hypothetical protein
MSSDKPVGTLAGLAAVGIALCCGLPLLLSLGAGITIAGFGLRSWVLAVAGLIALALGVVRFRHRRSCVPAPPSDRTEGSGDADRSRTR